MAPSGLFHQRKVSTKTCLRQIDVFIWESYQEVTWEVPLTSLQTQYSWHLQLRRLEDLPFSKGSFTRMFHLPNLSNCGLLFPAVACVSQFVLCCCCCCCCSKAQQSGIAAVSSPTWTSFPGRINTTPPQKGNFIFLTLSCLQVAMPSPRTGIARCRRWKWPACARPSQSLSRVNNRTDFLDLPSDLLIPWFEVT